MRRLGPRGGSKRFRLGELHSEGSIRGVLRSSKRNIAGLTVARRVGFYDLPALMAEEKAARAARAKAQLLVSSWIAVAIAIAAEAPPELGPARPHAATNRYLRYHTKRVFMNRSTKRVRGLSEAWLVALCSCCVCLLALVPSVFVASGNKLMMI